MRNGMSCGPVGCAPTLRGARLGETTAGTFFVGFLLFATAASLGYAIGFERATKK